MVGHFDRWDRRVAVSDLDLEEEEFAGGWGVRIRTHASRFLGFAVDVECWDQ